MTDADRELVAEETDVRFETFNRGLGLEMPQEFWAEIPADALADADEDEDRLGEEPIESVLDDSDELPVVLETAVVEPEERAGVAVQRYREGPWRVVCYRQSEIVFEHDQIYRVWMEDHHPPQWGYETVDGVRFRGRMGTDLNCNWRRL